MNPFTQKKLNALKKKIMKKCKWMWNLCFCDNFLSFLSRENGDKPIQSWHKWRTRDRWLESRLLRRWAPLIPVYYMVWIWVEIVEISKNSAKYLPVNGKQQQRHLNVDKSIKIPHIIMRLRWADKSSTDGCVSFLQSVILAFTGPAAILFYLLHTRGVTSVTVRGDQTICLHANSIAYIHTRTRNVIKKGAIFWHVVRGITKVTKTEQISQQPKLFNLQGIISYPRSSIMCHCLQHVSPCRNKNWQTLMSTVVAMAPQKS